MKIYCEKPGFDQIPSRPESVRDGRIAPLFALKDLEICLKPVFSRYNSLSPTGF